MRHTVCDHEWIENYDAVEDAACYKDGFNYRPAEYICTKCKETKKIKYKDEMKWYGYLLLIPFLVMILLSPIIAPLLMLIGSIQDEFAAKKA